MIYGNGLPNTLIILYGNNWERLHKQMKVLFGYQDTFEVVSSGVKNIPTNEIEA